MDDPYVTYHNNFIESEWWALKQIWEKGLLYKGFKIVPYCPRCGTPLSSHEVAQGYKELIARRHSYVSDGAVWDFVPTPDSSMSTEGNCLSTIHLRYNLYYNRFYPRDSRTLSALHWEKLTLTYSVHEVVMPSTNTQLTGNIFS
jgi:hypothetical protein